MNTMITPDFGVKMTNSAVLKVYELIQEEKNPGLKLRAFVIGGGCSGFKYGFSFEENKTENDFEFAKQAILTVSNPNDLSEEQHTVAIDLLVDALSFPYLNGSEIDYRCDLQGQSFIIKNNPNAKTTCGCGSSFSSE